MCKTFINKHLWEKIKKTKEIKQQEKKKGKNRRSLIIKFFFLLLNIQIWVKSGKRLDEKKQQYQSKFNEKRETAAIFVAEWDDSFI